MLASAGWERLDIYSEEMESMAHPTGADRGDMTSVEMGSESAAGTPPVKAGEFKLEVVVLPVSDVDRAKAFYEGLGWRLDADIAPDDSFRIVQFMPPGSACSIQFGTNITSAAPGSLKCLYLAAA